MTDWKNKPLYNIKAAVENKKLNVKKDGYKDKERRIVRMRTAKSIFKRDFKEVEVPEKDTNTSDVVKALKVVNNNLKIFVHLLLNIRTNQVIVGKAKGVKFETLSDKDEGAVKPEK